MKTALDLRIQWFRKTT